MGLELRTEQQLRISQKLLESLEILQMNEEQLFRYLSDVAESNPVIDFSWDDFSDHARKPVTDDPGKTEFIDNISDPAQDTETFQDYLQLQIHWDRYCEPDSRILSYLIDNLGGYPFDGYVCMNGGLVLLGGEVVFKQPVDREMAGKVIDICRERDIACVAFLQDT